MTRGHKVLAAACSLAAAAALGARGRRGGRRRPARTAGQQGLVRRLRHRRHGRFRPVLRSRAKHPAVIESFRTWGTDFPDSIVRWQTARARPMIHITTADPNDGHELISLQAIAEATATTT